MAVITNYAELVTAVSKWMARDMSADADELLALLTAYLNTKLRVRQMETVADLTPASGVCTLPTDYLEAKRVVEKASIRRRLDYITEDAADRLYPTRASGLACHYMIVGSNLTALPLSGNDIELTYYQKIPLLTSDEPTNWLLTAYPGLYLSGCKLFAADLNRDDGLMTKEVQVVERMIGNMHALDTRSKLGNAPVTLSGVVW